jgi:hypothetical protein
MDARIAEYHDSDPPSHYKGEEIIAIHAANSGSNWGELADRVVRIETRSKRVCVEVMVSGSKRYYVAAYVVFHYEPGQFLVFDSEREAHKYCDDRDLRDMEDGKAFPPGQVQHLVGYKANREARERNVAAWEARPTPKPAPKNAAGKYYLPRPAPRKGDGNKAAQGNIQPRVDNVG